MSQLRGEKVAVELRKWAGHTFIQPEIFDHAHFTEDVLSERRDGAD